MSVRRVIEPWAITRSAGALTIQAARIQTAGGPYDRGEVLGVACDVVLKERMFIGYGDTPNTP